MSLIKLQGNPSGSGAFTIAAPNSNTDRTLTLPDATGTVVTADGSGNIATTSITPSAGIYLGGSGSANLLDDYEEGTWTPTVRGSGTAGSYTPGTAVGTYTKIGRFVALAMRVNSITGSGGTGYIQFRGLPFSKMNNNLSNVSAVRVRFVSTSAFDYPTLEFASNNSSDTLYIFCNQPASGGFDLPVGALTESSEFIGEIFYETDA